MSKLEASLMVFGRLFHSFGADTQALSPASFLEQGTSMKMWLLERVDTEDGRSWLTWSRGMSRMSGILILSYRLKEVINFYLLHCFKLHRIAHISSTSCPIEMGLDQNVAIKMDKWFILKNQNWKLQTCDSLFSSTSHCKVERIRGEI